MLRLFKSNTLVKAHQAMTAEDSIKFAQLLSKLSDAELQTPVSDELPSLLELSILHGQSKMLEQILQVQQTLPNNCDSRPELSLVQLVLQQPQSHALLSKLITALPKTERDTLADNCFTYCQENQLMLHLSLLSQQGIALQSEHLLTALKRQDKALIHFLINSDVALPEASEYEDADGEMVAYAKKCADDLKIRQMFL